MKKSGAENFLAVEKSKIILTAVGGWKWGNGKDDLEMILEGSKYPLIINGASILTEIELINEIKKNLSGQSYKYQPIANSGLMQPKGIDIDKSTLFTAILIAGEKQLISNETNGTFSILVTTPSTLPDISNTPDPSSSHKGTWKIVEPNQRLVIRTQFTSNRNFTCQHSSLVSESNTEKLELEDCNANFPEGGILVTSVSWIDKHGFPDLDIDSILGSGFSEKNFNLDNIVKNYWSNYYPISSRLIQILHFLSFIGEDMISWPTKVILGLFMSHNDTPKDKLPDRFFSEGEKRLLNDYSSISLEEKKELFSYFSNKKRHWAEEGKCKEDLLKDFLEDYFSNKAKRFGNNLFIGESTKVLLNKILDNFFWKREFRAVIQYIIKSDGTIGDILLESGYTPDISFWKDPSLNLAFSYWLRPVSTFQVGFDKGQKSRISSVLKGKLHPNSSLKLPEGAKIVSSALIKFRAGEGVNKIGIEQAESPYQVPWVWSEHAVICVKSQLKIIAKGSLFPSHACYINQKQVLKIPQRKVEKIPKIEELPTGDEMRSSFLTAGAEKNSPFGSPEGDISEGSIERHEYTLKSTNNQKCENISIKIKCNCN